MKKFLIVAALVLSTLCGVAWAEDGYVRLAINRTNVNLRPQPRAAGGIVMQANAEDVFIAEKWPIVLDDDKTEWYKLVLLVNDRLGMISTVNNFKNNVAFVRADLAEVSPLKDGDMEKILATPVGMGYSFDVDPHGDEFSAMTKDNFRFFSYWSTIGVTVDILNADIWGGNFEAGFAGSIGHYPVPENYSHFVLLAGTNADGTAFKVMDPSFRLPTGWVIADAVRTEALDPDPGLDFTAFNAFCKRYLGANIGEIVRKWGDFTVERRAIDVLGEGDYNIFSSLHSSDIQLRFYEQTPGLHAEEGVTPYNAISFLQSFFFDRKGSGIGGIYIGVDWCGKDWVTKLLGEPDVKDADAVSEYWAWYSEFHDVRVRFEDELVFSVSMDTRFAD
jgi:hypothetical protein